MHYPDDETPWWATGSAELERRRASLASQRRRQREEAAWAAQRHEAMASRDLEVARGLVYVIDKELALLRKKEREEAKLRRDSSRSEVCATPLSTLSYSVLREPTQQVAVRPSASLAQSGHTYAPLGQCGGGELSKIVEPNRLMTATAHHGESSSEALQHTLHLMALSCHDVCKSSQGPAISFASGITEDPYDPIIQYQQRRGAKKEKWVDPFEYSKPY